MDLLYWLVLFANGVCVTAVLYSIRNPGRQIWPPPGRDTWEYWVVVVADAVCSLGVPAVAYLDRGSMEFGGPSTRFLGSAMFLVSVPVVAWAIYTLSLRQSFGLRGSLVTGGPYRYSRNPQYVGFFLMYGGILLVAMSVKGYVAGALFLLFIFLAPFSEEIWLMKQFGEAYEEYMRRASPVSLGTGKSHRNAKETMQVRIEFNAVENRESKE